MPLAAFELAVCLVLQGRSNSAGFPFREIFISFPSALFVSELGVFEISCFIPPSCVDLWFCRLTIHRVAGSVPLSLLQAFWTNMATCETMPEMFHLPTTHENSVSDSLAYLRALARISTLGNRILCTFPLDAIFPILTQAFAPQERGGANLSQN